MKSALKIMFVFGAIGWLLWMTAPRLLGDLWHARDFVPAQNYTIKDYKCTTWNLFMFNDCTVTFVALQSGESRQIMDFRFGPAPSDPVRLLQRRDDASAVTTDVSLRTVWNRLLMVLMLVLGGACVVMALIARAVKDEEVPVGSPGEEPAFQAAPQFARQPAPQPARRAGFGRRNA